jgi:opacity protein-like surface antigen
MRKTLIGVVCIIAAIFTGAQANAQPVGEWYYRADVGWSGATNANIHDRNSADHTIIGPNGTPGSLSDIGSGWLVGGGLGYTFLPNVRGDLVYTYRGGYELDESDQAAVPTRFKADIMSHSLMANVYGDFPMGGFVPFVGFGVGWSQITLSNLSATTTAAVNPLSGAVGATAFAPGGTSDNFAWQVMAGVGYQVSPGIMVDLFYRYFDGGHGKSEAGNVIALDGTVIGTYHGAEGALHAHEVSVSLRFSVGD